MQNVEIVPPAEDILKDHPQPFKAVRDLFGNTFPDYPHTLYVWDIGQTGEKGMLIAPGGYTDLQTFLDDDSRCVCFTLHDETLVGRYFTAEMAKMVYFGKQLGMFSVSGYSYTDSNPINFVKSVYAFLNHFEGSESLLCSAEKQLVH